MHSSNPELPKVSVPNEEITADAGPEAISLAVLPVAPGAAKSTLAKRISSRTTDLLAIAIVLVGSMALGRQVLSWWHEAPPAVLPPGILADLDTEWGAEDRPVELDFGTSPVRLIRQSVGSGGPVVALGVIQEACQKALIDAVEPIHAPDPAELEMLRTVAKLQADVEQPGLWQIHRLGGNMVTLIGVRFFPNRDQTGPVLKATENGHAMVENGASTTAGLIPRVICWGLTFPGRAPGSWITYTFIKKQRSESADPQAKSTAQTASVGDAGSGLIPLPENCRRTVFVSEGAWNSLLGFQGVGNAAAWRRHFSNWLISQKWTCVEDWVELPGTDGWSASFVHEGELNQAEEQSNAFEEHRILIHLQVDSTGSGSGVIHSLPGRKSQVSRSD